MWNLLYLAALPLALIVLWAMLTQPLAGRRACTAPSIDPARLQAHVRMLSETLSPRSWDDEENTAQVADYLAAHLKPHAAEYDELVYDPKHGGVRSRVLVARFGPDTDDVLVVGAHYDAWGSLPGADDNASGVAVLLELAPVLAANPPRSRVELVAWPNEEPPHFLSIDMGSAQHARALKARGKRVRAVSLEMLGYFSDAPGSQTFPMPLLKLFYPSTGNFIALVGKFGEGGMVREWKRAMRGGSDLPVFTINAPRFVPGIDFSDHAAYWDEGFEALMVTDTSFYRNDRYHTERDTWDTLDYARMAKVAQGVACAISAATSR